MKIEDLLEQYLCDRIDMLSKDRPKESQDKDKELYELQEKAVEKLDPETRQLVEHFFDELITQTGEDNRFFYLSGISDAFKVVKLVLK